MCSSDLGRMETVGFTGAKYMLYEDDGVTKEYEKEGRYRELVK